MLIFFGRSSTLLIFCHCCRLDCYFTPCRLFGIRSDRDIAFVIACLLDCLFVSLRVCCFVSLFAPCVLCFLLLRLIAYMLSCFLDSLLARNNFRRLLFARNFEADVEVKTDSEAGLKLVWGLVWGLENCLARRLENSVLSNAKVLQKNRRFGWTSSAF